MHTFWDELLDDPLDDDRLAPPPFCFRFIDEKLWHVTPGEGEAPPGSSRYVVGVMERYGIGGIGHAACGAQGRVQVPSVQREPTCETCRRLVIVGRIQAR